MNNMSLKNIKNLFQAEQSNTGFLEIGNKKSELIGNLNEEIPFDEKMNTEYQIHLDTCKYFRKQIYGLNDESFSIFKKRNEFDNENNIIILPFQLKYYTNNTNTCIYALKFSFKSLDESLEIDSVFIPYLKSQNSIEIDQVDLNKMDLTQIITDDHLTSEDTELIIHNNLIFLLLKVKVKNSNPTKIYISLEFNNDSGITFFNDLKDIDISFQDLLHPSPNDDWELTCYNIIKNSKVNNLNNFDLKVIESCKVLDIPSNLVNDYLEKCFKIFEINFNQLKSLINEEFQIFEEFDFEHDLLINKQFKLHDNINIQFRWFCIHLFPNNHLIMQFSIIEHISIVRLYTDMPDILSHCDNFFDSWLIEEQPAI